MTSAQLVAVNERQSGVRIKVLGGVGHDAMSATWSFINQLDVAGTGSNDGFPAGSSKALELGRRRGGYSTNQMEVRMSGKGTFRATNELNQLGLRQVKEASTIQTTEDLYPPTLEITGSVIKGRIPVQVQRYPVSRANADGERDQVVPVVISSKVYSIHQQIRSE